MAEKPEKLDHDGDFILVIGGDTQDKRRFLVSSKILSLVSLAFKDIFARHSHSLLGTPREISLPDDDPAAMSTILQILHYQWDEQTLPLSPKRLAILASYCSKYKCVKAFQPWITHLFDTSLKLTVEEYDLLLLAAHFLRASTVFSQLSAQAQLHLHPQFTLEWDKFGLDKIPRPIKCKYPIENP